MVNNLFINWTAMILVFLFEEVGAQQMLRFFDLMNLLWFRLFNEDA